MNKNSIIELMLPYMLLNMMSGDLSNIGKPNKRKKKKGNVDELIEVLEENEMSDEDEENENENEMSDEGDDECEDEDEDEDEETFNTAEEESSDEESEFDYDEYDDTFIELIENDINEDEEIEYFQNLEPETKIKHIDDLKEIKEINNSNIPLRFKVLGSEMDIRTKSMAIENIDKLSEMDVSTGEYCKMDKWINGLIKIPFGKYKELGICDENENGEKQDFIYNTYNTLDKAIYGHKEAKLHILQVIGKWIKNPISQGNVLALQGPMGNGKTTLVKEGIAKAIDRPFAFIALGGASDSAFFDGHSYTYEGSHWGRIIDILIESKCMNPIIYFDELDKVSGTQKGEEIIHLLTHLTDPSQNSLFQDNYFPGVHIDLSKALFIFSFNDETRVDRILKDRMYVINTKGFKPKDKVNICIEYILPELMDTFIFNRDDMVFTEEALLYIIENYTQKEEGVRNLKRCLETIIAKINIYNLSKKESSDKNVPLDFEIENFKLPLTVNKDIIEKLISKKEDDFKPPEHMYM
jgi:ATP-dependent Lon protease